MYLSFSSLPFTCLPFSAIPCWSNKETENPQGISLWRPVGSDYRISTGLGKQRLGRHKKKPCEHQDPGERISDPTRDQAILGCECLGFSGGGLCQQQLAAWSGKLTAAVLGGTACWRESFWRRSPLPLYSPSQASTVCELWISRCLS